MLSAPPAPSATHPRATPATSAQQRDAAAPNASAAAAPDPAPSVFASNALRPALGKTFPYFLDAHLLVGAVPRRKRDAERFCAAGGEMAGKSVQFASVVEVLLDRYGGRVGRWVGFVVDKESGKIGSVT